MTHQKNDDVLEEFERQCDVSLWYLFILFSAESTSLTIINGFLISVEFCRMPIR